MSFRLVRFLYRETSDSNLRIVGASTISGVSRGALLATFNGAAAAAAAGTGISPLLVGGFVAALLVYLVATYSSGRWAQYAIETMTERLRLRLCAKLLLTQLRFLEQQGTGDVYTQLSHDLNRLASAAVTFLAAFQALVLVAFALVYLAYLSLWALAATMLAIAAGATTYYWQDDRARRNVQQTRELQRQFFDGINDLLYGFKELKLSRARHEALMGHLGEIAGEYRDLNVRTETMFLTSFLTAQTFTFILLAALVFGLPSLFPAQSLLVFQFLATVLFLVGPIETLARAIPTAAKARVSLEGIERLEASLDQGIAEEEHRDSVAPLDFESIEFRKAHFRFSGENAHEQFDVGPIDLKVRSGEILFVIGGNGAGKTTFLKMLSGLYQPTSGAVLVDGRQLQEGDWQAYREMFAAVFSDFHLFRRLYGIESGDPELIGALLAELEIDHKTRVQDGVLTTINLSAGQRKRLAYAISRLADRKVYIFDEFAADQDPDFRRYFYTQLLPRLRADGKTIIAVTHDERWFATADRILKMEYGSIAGLVTPERAAEAI